MSSPVFFVVSLVVIVVGVYAQCSIDICFAVDESGSLGTTNFGKELDFVNSATTAMRTRDTSSEARFSAWLFDQDSGPDDFVSALTGDLSQFQNDVNSFKTIYSGGYTNMYAGLDRCRETLNDSARERVTVLITDGTPNRGPGQDQSQRAIEENVRTLASTMNLAGINIFTVGVYGTDTSGLALGLLSDIASNGSYAVTANFDDLQLMGSSLSASLCEVSLLAVQPTPSTSVAPVQKAAHPECKCAPSTEVKTGNCVSEVAQGVCFKKSCSGTSYVCDLMSPHVCTLESRTAYVCAGYINATHCACNAEVHMVTILKE